VIPWVAAVQPTDSPAHIKQPHFDFRLESFWYGPVSRWRGECSALENPSQLQSSFEVKKKKIRHEVLSLMLPVKKRAVEVPELGTTSVEGSAWK